MKALRQNVYGRGWLCASLVFCLFFLVYLAASPDRVAVAEESGVTVTKLEDRFRVEIGGDLFTEYVFQGYNKPILYPVIGPYDLPMTRNYPMKTVKGEAKDHPHHRSLWFTHGDVNGISFWHENSGAGKIVHDEILEHSSGGDHGVIATRNKWVDAGGKTVCTDTRKITFRRGPGSARIIDHQITIHASSGKLAFGDTKEGTMGIRTHPNLRLSNDKGRGVTTANGNSVNSEGVRNREMWGKRAKWVDYWGKIDGKVVGVAIFDHPSNLRHPTWWHARHYGLIAANPFGVHDFERKPEGTGDLTLAAGESITFRHRFVFHKGDVETAKVEKMYGEFAKN